MDGEFIAGLGRVRKGNGDPASSASTLGRGYPGFLILVLGWVLLSVRLPVPPRFVVSLFFSVLYL